MTGVTQQRPARRRLTTTDRRAEILHAAVDIFAERDVEQVSVGEIAERAGASPALIYHYFGGKAGLAEEALNTAADSLLALLVPAPAGNVLDRLLPSLDSYLDFLESHPASWAALLRAGGNPTTAAIAQRVDDSAAALLVTTIRDGGFDSQRLTFGMYAWIDLLKGACLRWLESGEPERAELRDFLAAAFVGCVVATGAADDAAALIA